MSTDYLSRTNINRQIAKDQRELLNQIMGFTSAGQNLDTRGLGVLRRNIEATANHALSITFPTVKRLIGDTLFSHASEQYLRLDPPSEGDWADWGARFAECLVSVAALDDYPYVAESAKLDWYRHLIERGQDFVLDTQSLGLLASHPLDGVGVKLAPNLRVMRSEYPVLHVWQANHHQDKAHALAEYKQRVASGALKQNILLSRCEFKVKMSELSSDEAAWFDYLKEGGSLGQGLAHLTQMGFTLDTWLPWAMNNHLICGLQRDT